MYLNQKLLCILTGKMYLSLYLVIKGIFGPTLVATTLQNPVTQVTQDS